MSKLNYYWVRYTDLNGVQSQSIVPAHNKAEAIVIFQANHPGYKTMGAKLVPAE